MTTPDKKPERFEQEEPQPDPTIRQDFPGAASNKQKIEVGKRNTRQTTGKKVKPEDDVPKSDAEPIEPGTDSTVGIP